MFGQYDSSDSSMDTLGLNVNADMYSVDDKRIKGRYRRNIIICSIIILAAIAWIISISQKHILHNRIINNGTVTEAAYNSNSDRYSAKITLNDGNERQRSWENTWEYKNDGDIMKIYMFTDGDKTYITPQNTAAAWALMYSVPGVIILLASVFITISVRGIAKLKKDKETV